MNIVMNIDNIDYNSISFYNPIKNKYKNYDIFYKLIYNCYNYTISTFIINIPIEDMYYVDEEHKTLSFTHKLKEKLKKLEIEILKKMSCFNKNYRYILELPYNTLVSNNIINNISLKIYGIWKNKDDIGLVYRFST